MPANSHIFRAQVEDWEKDILLRNDCMADARLLEKYNNLVFCDPRDEDTYTVFKKILSSTG